MAQSGSSASQDDAGVSPRVSVIVPVYNGEEGIHPLLDALRAQTYPRDRLEIIIVDNGSKDATMRLVEAYAAEHPAPPVRLVTEHEIQGSYAARNKGVAAAQGEILAFTDADCRPMPDWIEAGSRRLHDEGVDQVAGAIQFFFAGARPNPWEHIDCVMHLRQELYVRNNAFGATANLIVRAASLKAAGGFRSELKSGGDFEFGQRMKAHGFTIAYGPDAVVGHAARASHEEVATKVRRVAAGVTFLEGEGRVGGLSLKDLKPRRRLPEGAPKLPTSPLRHVVLVALVNYFHYMRLRARLKARAAARTA